MKNNIFFDIFSFFKNIFKKEKIKLIPKNFEENIEDNFYNSLKQNVNNNYNKKVKVLVCNGDGLGIYNNINY